jgi:hypothetical protein
MEVNRRYDSIGRGLSELQKRVLEILESVKDRPSGTHRHWYGSSYDVRSNPDGMMYFQELGHMINGKHASPSKRSALSRAIARLHDRELIQLYDDGTHAHSGFGKDRQGSYKWISITDRGSAYLRGEKIPPLEPVRLPEPGRCFCGADISTLKDGYNFENDVDVHPLPSTRQQRAGIQKGWWS